VGRRLDQPNILSGAKYDLREALIVLGIIASICVIAAIVLL
jgi:hypothetical protein